MRDVLLPRGGSSAEHHRTRTNYFKEIQQIWIGDEDNIAFEDVHWGGEEKDGDNEGDKEVLVRDGE